MITCTTSFGVHNWYVETFPCHESHSVMITLNRMVGLRVVAEKKGTSVSFFDLLIRMASLSIFNSFSSARACFFTSLGFNMALPKFSSIAVSAFAPNWSLERSTKKLFQRTTLPGNAYLSSKEEKRQQIW